MAARKKPIDREAGAKPVAPVDEATNRAGVAEPSVAETASGGEHREARIRSAAYAAAERRGFVPGRELDDWLAAEQEIDGGTSACTSASS